VDLGLCTRALLAQHRCTFSRLARVVRLAQVLACALSMASAPWAGPDAKSSLFLHNFCSLLLLTPPVFISASHNLEKHHF